MVCQRKIVAVFVIAFMVCCLVVETDALQHISYGGVLADGTPCWLGHDANKLKKMDSKNEDVSLILSSDAKPRLKWTPELHQRFIDAINQLGGADRATPKSLMRIMGIHGLTLYHLKSHLQKYRLGKGQISLGSAQNEQYRIADYEESERNRTIEYFWEADQEQPDGTLQISQALQIQMKVQMNLSEHVEIQKRLELRIEAQRRYLQSVLQKAQDIFHCPGSPFSLLTELDVSLPLNAETTQFGRNGCSFGSSLTSTDNSENIDNGKLK